MSGQILLQELTREDARALAPRCLVVLPVGATEQHGPHLPVMTDTIAVEYIAREAATRVVSRIPILVAPTLPYGSSDQHLPFGGTMSLRTGTYYRVLCELVESLVTSGFRRVFIVNGHGGNHELAQLAARDMAVKHPVSVAAASYWTVSWDKLLSIKAYAVGRVIGHGGAFETSQVMALRPDLVRQPLPHRDEAAPSTPPPVTRPYRAEFPGWGRSNDGFTDSPDRATPELGKSFLETSAGALAAAYLEFYEASSGCLT